MGEVLKYGMVGGGPGAFIGKVHRAAIALDGKARIVAGSFSRTQEKNRQVAEELGISSDRCYVTYREMAEKVAERADGIDFVIIVTPNSSHFEICKAFLEAGIHVVCDKPVTTTHAQAVELNRLAQSRNLLFMVTYTYMGNVTVKYARDLVRQGAIGDIRVIMAEYPQGQDAFVERFDPSQGGWRNDPHFAGNFNCLGDLGTHVENVISTITGLKIRRVLAKLETVVPGKKLDDNDYILVEYDNGATGTYWLSKVAGGSDNGLCVRIYGSKGSIFWHQEDAEKLVVVDSEGKIQEVHRGHHIIEKNSSRYDRMPAGHAEGLYGAMGNLYQSFLECLSALKAGNFTEDMIDYPSIKDGEAGLAFIEACLESNKDGNIWKEMCN